MSARSGSRPQSIDIFAGAGGLTVALEQAGFQTVAAVDVDSDAMGTLQATQDAEIEIPDSGGSTYLASTKLIEADIGEIEAADLRPRGRSASWRPDLLAGGPPCQPFSSAGKQRGIHDPRGKLFLEFVRLTAELKPRYVLFENVRGLLTQKDAAGRPGGVLELVQQSFEDIGYAVRFAVLNAADYGAPQRRVRLYMLGTADHRLLEFPAPTHSAQLTLEGHKPWVTLGEFLSGRQVPNAEDVVRPTGKRARDLLALTPGTGLKTGGVVEYQRPSGHWGYRQDSFLADPSLPSRTIRAASTPDWIRLTDGTMRRLTWHECGGLQGFPDDWRFTGTRASRFRQIGNAVCVDVGRSLGHTVRRGLAMRRPSRPPTSAEWPPEFRRRINYTAMEERVCRWP